MIDPLRRRVVFIDDDEALVSMMERASRTHAPHWNLVSAPAVIRGLVMAGAGVNLIILDLGLIDASPSAAIAFIPWLSIHSPVVVLTGMDLREDGRKQRCIDAGARLVVAKAELNDGGLERFLVACQKITG